MQKEGWTLTDSDSKKTRQRQMAVEKDDTVEKGEGGGNKAKGIK
jgi:hypothetical protein